MSFKNVSRRSSISQEIYVLEVGMKIWCVICAEEQLDDCLEFGFAVLVK